MRLNRLFQILFTSAVISGCNFLDTEPLDFRIKDEVYKTMEDADRSLTGIYRLIMFEYGGNYATRMACTDDLGFYDEEIYPIGVYNNNYTASNGNVAKFWAGLYEGINNANALLEEIGSISVKNEEQKNQLVAIEGETRFLRAFAYTLLAQCWGDVPYKTESQKSVTDVFIAKTSQKEVYQNAIDEMIKAESMVKEVDEVSMGRVSKSAVRGILARTYLKMAGWPFFDRDDESDERKKYYAEALRWAKKVNKDNKHRLNPDFSQIFINYASDKHDSEYRESIWEVDYKGNSYDGHSTAGSIAAVYGILNTNSTLSSLGYSYGRIVASLNLWDLYNDDNGDGVLDDSELEKYKEGSDAEYNHPDTRRDWTIAPYTFTTNSKNENVKIYKSYKGRYTYDKEGVQSDEVAGKTSYIGRNSGKYRREYEVVVPRHKNVGPINFPVLRYSDVLLMIAEAENELNGPTEEAYSCINLLRRVRIPTSSSIENLTKDQFRQLVKDERGRELAFEALRKYDLIRWGDYEYELLELINYVNNDSRWGGRKFATLYAQQVLNGGDRYKWLPIPEIEISLNHLLTQTPSW